MNVKQKALLATFKFVASIILGAILLLILAEIFGPSFVTWLLIGSLFASSVYMMYTYNVTRLTWEERDREQERKEPKL